MNIKLDDIIAIAVNAGREILDVYSQAFAVETKADGSPLTLADKRAHAVIEAQLGALTPKLPVVSEEARAPAARCDWQRFWLVDPLDGTKEFVKRNGEFSVNIALIEGDKPTLGVVHAPVSGEVYAAAGGRAFKIDNINAAAARINIRARAFDRTAATIATSRSHGDAKVAAFAERMRANNLPERAPRERYAKVAAIAKRLRAQGTKVDIIRIGSSLKICRIAEGAADVYPRFGPTSEWDTAAAHAVLAAAGGRVVDLSGAELTYNKRDILNPWFLALGDAGFDWVALARDLS